MSVPSFARVCMLFFLGDAFAVCFVRLQVHTFRNPFAGSRSRVCQALVLPPFQRQGHGRRLLREVRGRCGAALLGWGGGLQPVPVRG
jgi:ribosomal protein S18 acetylase RimI-like enzyme